METLSELEEIEAMVLENIPDSSGGERLLGIFNNTLQQVNYR